MFTMPPEEFAPSLWIFNNVKANSRDYPAEHYDTEVEYKKLQENFPSQSCLW